MADSDPGAEQDDDNEWPPLTPVVYDISRARRSSAYEGTAPVALCEGCRALKFYTQISSPPPSETALDLGLHPGLQSFSKLEQSAESCACCNLILNEIKRELPHTDASRPGDIDLDALELRCYVTANENMPGDRGIFFGLYSLEEGYSRVEAGASLSIVLVRGMQQCHTVDDET